MDISFIDKFKKVKTNPTLEYKIVSVLIFLSLAVFWTSTMWLPNAEKVQYTQLGSKGSTSAITELVLKSWEYNPTLKLMEVIIEINDDKNLNRSEFDVKARLSQAKSLPCEIVIKGNGMMIVHIKNIPKKFKVISLWIDQKENQITNAKQHTSVNFRCDYREVAVNETLAVKSHDEYLLLTVDNEINDVKQKVSDIENKISTIKVSIINVKNDISILRDDMKYQTDDEISSTEKLIKSKQQDIEFSEGQIQSELKNISSLNEKLVLLNQKRNDTLKKTQG